MTFKVKFFFVLAIIISFATIISTAKVNAQSQDKVFSGNDPNSYQCFDKDGKVIGPGLPDSNGDGFFDCADGTRAKLIPPKLAQLEIWFVRIVYVIWAVIAGLSFFMLIYLGYQYMLTKGDVTKITEIRRKIIYYILGVALVFLAVPILTTLFRVMGINKDEKCYNVNMPAFKFFYADLCTTGQGAGE